MADVFAKLITERTLAKLAGPASFGRGENYFARAAVTDLVVTKSAIKARVEGGDDYRVVLRAEGNKPASTCICPMGDEGALCKHLGAMGLGCCPTACREPSRREAVPAEEQPTWSIRLPDDFSASFALSTNATGIRNLR